MNDPRNQVLRAAVLRYVGIPVHEDDAQTILAAIDAVAHAAPRKDTSRLHVHDVAHELVVRSERDSLWKVQRAKDGTPIAWQFMPEMDGEQNV